MQKNNLNWALSIIYGRLREGLMKWKRVNEWVSESVSGLTPLPSFSVQAISFLWNGQPLKPCYTIASLSSLMCGPSECYWWKWSPMGPIHTQVNTLTNILTPLPLLSLFLSLSWQAFHQGFRKGWVRASVALILVSGEGSRSLMSKW